MFVVNIVYVAALEEVDIVRPAHLEWLKGGYEAGHLIGWGRKTSGDGGILLGVGERAAVEAFAQTDPYVQKGVARSDVIEFQPSFLAPGLDMLDR